MKWSVNYFNFKAGFLYDFSIAHLYKVLRNISNNFDWITLIKSLL